MKASLILGVLMILPFISCGVTYGQVFRNDYSLDERSGSWLKFHRLPQVWEQAHLTCLNEGAFLVSPITDEVTQSLRLLMVEHGVTTSPIFTGISSLHSNSFQRNVEGDSASHTYTQTTETCVGFYPNGTKVNLPCFERHPFACYLKAQDTEQTDCGTADLDYVRDNRTGSCYKVYQDQQHKWADAQAICQQQGGHLAVINSQIEAEVIWELAKESQSVYAVSIGFREVQGGHWRSDRTWVTVQGESLEEAGYARFFDGEPNSFDENCGSVIFSGNKEDGILNDVSCDMDLMFICEIEPTTTTQTSPEPRSLTLVDSETEEYEFRSTVKPDSNTNLGPEYVTVPEGFACNTVPECDTLDKEYVLNNRTGSCYKEHVVKKNWDQAYATCMSEGGHLAVINSEEEAEVLWDLAKDNTYSTFVGFRAFGTDRQWVTVQGQTLADAGYEDWNTGEPSVPSQNERCGGLNGSIQTGILNDVWCHIDLQFICEIEPRASTFMGA